MNMQRALRFTALLMLMMVATVCARAENEPAILRTDAFVAARYDARTAVVFFSSQSLGANPGAPAGLPQGATRWIGGHRLQIVRNGAEKEWAKRWPGGADSAPQMGAEFVLALGGSAWVHGRLSTLGYLPLCDTTWLVGLVSVDASDREAFGQLDAEGFVAYTAPTAARALPDGSAVGLIGPVIVFSDTDAMGDSDKEARGAARAKIEAALKSRVTADYANYLSQRQMTYEKEKPTALVHVQGDAEMIAGRAKLSYTAQKVMVGPGTPRYYVRAVWRSTSGEALYTISAWFTPEWEMESVTDSEAPLGTSTEDNDRILNIFPLAALPMLEQHADEDAQYSVLLMEERGPEGALYSLKRWTEGGLLPTGVYFANRCK